MRHEFHESAQKDYEVRDNSCRAPARFWRNVTLIALAHLALIAGLIRWSVAAKVPSNPESILWFGRAENLALEESAKQESPSKHATASPESRPLKNDEAEKEKHRVTTAKSKIELPSPTPKTTPTSTPASKPSTTPAPKPKPTQKPIPKRTPKETLVAKASPKPKTKLTSEKFSETSAKNEKKILPKNDSQSQSGRGKTTSAGKAGSAPGGNSASEFGWYGNMLHDRLYSAWIQPTTNVASGTKISTLVKLRIEKDGRVSKFEIIKPSENVVVNESVEAIAKRVSEVDPPPAGLINGDHYDVKINFELNTDQGTESR